MRRASTALIFAAAALCAAGCACSRTTGDVEMWSHDFSGAPAPGMIARGTDDARRLDSSLGRASFLSTNQDTSREWESSSAVVARGEGACRRSAGEYVIGLDPSGEVKPLAVKTDLSFERTPALTAISEFLKKTNGVQFFDAGDVDRKELEGVLLTAKAGGVEKEMIFPYLRAVFQMNGLDLLPVEIPFYGRGFKVVKLEGVGG